MMDYDIVELHKIISERFDEEELEDLCFRLNIKYTDIKSNTLSAKARELIRYCDRHDILDDLVEQIQEDRPDIDLTYVQFPPYTQPLPPTPQGTFPHPPTIVITVPSLPPHPPQTSNNGWKVASILAMIAIAIVITYFIGLWPLPVLRPPITSTLVRRSTPTATETALIFVVPNTENTSTPTIQIRGIPFPIEKSSTPTPTTERRLVVSYYGSDGVALRPTPDRGIKERTTLYPPEEILVIDGPRAGINNLVWWRVRTQYETGYVAEVVNGFRLVKPKISIGDRVVVSNLYGDRQVYLRNDCYDDRNSRVLEYGTPLIIKRGPAKTCSSRFPCDECDWWYAATVDGTLEGWIADVGATTIKAVLIAPEWYADAFK